MSYELIDLVQQLGQPKLLVLGDLILDRYVWGNVERISPEAPVIVLLEDRQEIRLGGAANVGNMIRGLDAQVTLAGVVGADVDGQHLRQELEAVGADCGAVVEEIGRPTTVKERLIGRTHHRHPHQMLRVDRESRLPINESTAEALVSAIDANIADYDAVLISDYAKGVCTPYVLSRVIRSANAAGIPVVVDPGSGANYADYAGATAITPNRLETGLAVNQDIESVEAAFAAGRQLCERLRLKYAFMTLDSDGIALVTADGSAELLPTRKREVYDITGAGDMVLAMIGVAVADRVAPRDLARLANVAGGLEVEQIGVVTVTRRQILADLLAAGRRTHEKIQTVDELERHVAARRKLGQKIVLTNGCFDVLHAGHVTYLQQAAAEGDCLIVALNSDASVRQLDKAPDRPVFAQDHRATMLAAMESVDYVIVFDDITPRAVIERLKPDLLVKGGTYNHDEIGGWELVESYGGAVKPLGLVDGVSTTDILRRLRGERAETTTQPALQIHRRAG